MPITLLDVNLLVSLLLSTHPHHAAIRGQKQITDVYLLRLAVRNGGRLAAEHAVLL